MRVHLKAIEAFKRYLKTRRDTPTDSESSEQSEQSPVTLQWPPNNSVPHECNGEGGATIELHVYHTGNYDAARIVAKWASASLCEAWGDKYRIAVTAIEDPPTVINDATDMGAWLNHVKASDSTAKDGNLLLVDGSAPDSATSHSAIVGHAARITDRFDVAEPVREYVGGAGGRRLMVAVHELLHTIGGDHETGGTRYFTGGTWAVTPMQTTYTESDTWTPLLHPRTIARGPDIQ